MARTTARAKRLAPEAAPTTGRVFTYRAYQRERIDRFHAGKRRQFWAWHRRAGKDVTAIKHTREEMDKRPGNYWHLYPLHAHARRALWFGVDPGTGVRYIDIFFADRVYTNDAEMFLRLPNGATWQLLGSDHYDRLVGAGTLGIVVSEWSRCDPRFYEYARPIIRENGGWIIFITTFLGRNHAWQQFQRLKKHPDWDCSLLTVRDTKRDDGSPVISEADVAKDRAEGMSEALIQQEYYCNPAAAIEGAIYGKSVAALADSGRASSFAYLPNLPVFASWSLEHAPVNVSVAFFQRDDGGDVRCIGSRSFMFTELADAVAEVRSSLPWRVSETIVPPESDGIYTKLLSDFGFRSARPAPALTFGKQTLVTQAMLGRLHVDYVTRPFADEDANNNELLLDSLTGYGVKQVNNEFTNIEATTYHRYLTRAVELFAATERVLPSRFGARDYSKIDRGVI